MSPTPSRSPNRLSESEAAALTLGPDSASWRYASDSRGFLLAGYTLLLQVAHPTVGSGVRDHSNFQREPWQRLLRTLDYVMLSVYGGEDAVEVTRRLREMHKPIKGTNPDGTRYHALEPGAYAWVQGTLVYAIIVTHQRFGGGLSEGDAERLYQEFLGLGRLLGIRPGDLPENWVGFQAYFEDVVANRLEHTESVDAVLASLTRPARPPVLPAWTEALWRVVSKPASYLVSLSTIGSLPPVLREKFGLSWTPARERQLKAVAAVSRAVTPVLPKIFKVNGPLYLRARAKAIPKNEFAPRRYRDERAVATG